VKAAPGSDAEQTAEQHGRARGARGENAVKEQHDLGAFVQHRQGDDDRQRGQRFGAASACRGSLPTATDPVGSTP